MQSKMQRPATKYQPMMTNSMGRVVGGVRKLSSSPVLPVAEGERCDIQCKGKISRAPILKNYNKKFIKKLIKNMSL
jgi:hypothetical protein